MGLRAIRIGVAADRGVVRDDGRRAERDPGRPQAARSHLKRRAGPFAEARAAGETEGCVVAYPTDRLMVPIFLALSRRLSWIAALAALATAGCQSSPSRPNPEARVDSPERRAAGAVVPA